MAMIKAKKLKQALARREKELGRALTMREFRNLLAGQK